jgi:photosystem II stability/assembly factor-like uncharacterized protein
MRTGFHAIGGAHPYLVARAQVLGMLRSSEVAPGAYEHDWEPLGPTNVGGRVRALAVDPRNADILYAGGVAGGVWKSEDAGASWSPLTETFSNVGVSSIAIDPTDSDVIYVGTGEELANRSDFTPFRGIGIMKTTDGGDTWRLLPQTIGDPAFRVVNDLVISAANPKVLYAGVSAGVARSVDAGRTWKTVWETPGVTGCGDLAIRTDRSPDVILASCADAEPDGVYLSEDGGEQWKKVIDVVYGERAGYAAVAFAPSDQDIAYASVARTADSPGGQTGTLALLRSDDGGRTWKPRNDGATNWLGSCGPETSGQGDYGNAIAVDPTDPDRLWLGGVDAFRSDDGGTTITIASYWWLDQRYQDLPEPAPWMHADFHGIWFDPGFDGSANQRVYFVNDGGVFRTDNARAPLPNKECDGDVLWNLTSIDPLNDVVYQPLNDGLVITQFWAGTVSNDGTIVMGGTQDNGTWIRRAGAGPDGWSFAIGGDGFDVAISPDNGLFYGELYGHEGIRIERSTTGNLQSFKEITKSAINDKGLFFTPFVMDPATPATLWTGGQKMWRTTDGGDLWVEASPVLPTRQHEAISAIAVAPGDPKVVYAGSNGGGLWMTENGASSPPSWSTSPVQQGYVSSIAVDPSEPHTAYATVGSFDVPHVLKTTDGGASWDDVGADLPNVPASSVAINPLDPDMVFVGTDAGAFESHNGGATWLPANGDLASTIVQDLVFRPGTSELYLFTFGRGAYRVDVGTGG